MKGNDRLAALEADFKDKLSGDELVKVEFPESGAPIYLRKIYSTFRKQPVIKAAAENRFDDFNALMIIQFALDEDGSYAFTPGAKDALIKKTDSQVLARVADEIAKAIKFTDENEVDFELEAAKKNSKQTQTSEPDLRLQDD